MTNPSMPVKPLMLRGQPFFGSAIELTHDRLAFIQRLSRMGGVTGFRMVYQPIYHLSEPEAVQHVLQDNARNYIKGKLFAPMRSLVGNGLFLSDGDFWLRQRRLMQPAFHQQRLAGLVEGMVSEIQVSIENWTRAAASGQTVNIAPETTALAMRVVTRALFSTGLSGAEQRLAAAITTIIDDIAFRFEVPFYPPISIPTPRNLRTRAALRTIDELVYAIINQRRGEQEVKDDLLAMLMEARDEDDGQGMSDSQLRDEVLIMFAAGHETTATAMAWAFYLLDRHPAVMAKVQTEVDEVLAGRAPTAADLRNLVYTRMVVDEVLRLYPPVFITNRQSLKEDVVCGYHIPAGSMVSISPYAIQRDPRYWPEPETFDPEHFNPQVTAQRPRYAYFPFGGGPRQCIGKDFALYEATLVLAMATQRFGWQVDPTARVAPAPLVTLRPNAVPVRFSLRYASPSTDRF